MRKLRTWLGRLDRDIGRKIAGNEELEAAFAIARERVAKILAQKAGDTDKLYALHAPEVECIAKGKARTKSEFGVKTSSAVTNARTAGGQFIVGMQALPGNPYDGHTLSGQIEQVERLRALRLSGPMSIVATRATSMAETPRSTSPTPAASPHPRSNANCGGEMPLSRSSGTRRPMACSSAITSRAPPAMPSMPSWSPPGTT